VIRRKASLLESACWPIAILQVRHDRVPVGFRGRPARQRLVDGVGNVVSEHVACKGPPRAASRSCRYRDCSSEKTLVGTFVDETVSAHVLNLLYQIEERECPGGHLVLFDRLERFPILQSTSNLIEQSGVLQRELPPCASLFQKVALAGRAFDRSSLAELVGQIQEGDENGETSNGLADRCKVSQTQSRPLRDVSVAAQRIGVNRRGIAPPDSAEPEKVDAETVQRPFEPRYSTSAFNALLYGAPAPEARDKHLGEQIAGPCQKKNQRNQEGPELRDVNRVVDAENQD
jgi:hypothetical protein